MVEPTHTPFPSTVPLTLGSASPRRAALLASLGFDFEVETVDLDEHALIDETERDPRVIVETIARAKFGAFPANGTDNLLLTADTLVACDGRVMGKPSTNGELTTMLESMSARELQIVTAVCVARRGAAPRVDTVTTTVELRPLMTDEIRAYVATGAGMDKAGGLALQTQAKPFIYAVHGCWSNVLGLPLCAASRLLMTDPGQSRCSLELCGTR